MSITSSSHVMLAHDLSSYCRSSWNVLCHVFFGRPLHLPSSGVHDVATFEGRWRGRRSMWPAMHLRSATVSASFLEPVLSRTSSNRLLCGPDMDASDASDSPATYGALQNSALID